MADTKISQLTEKQTLGANDLFVIATSGNNYNVKGSTIKTFAQDGLATVATSGSYADLTNTPTIPSKTSDLTNDSGYITVSDIPALPSNTDLSDYDNTTSKFVNETDLSGKQDVIDSSNKLDYAYLSNTPSIPSSIDDLSDVDIDSATLADGQLLKYDAQNSKWYNGSSSSVTVAWSDITGKPTFATVATSGNYKDLTNVPVISLGTITGTFSNNTLSLSASNMTLEDGALYGFVCPVTNTANASTATITIGSTVINLRSVTSNLFSPNTYLWQEGDYQIYRYDETNSVFNLVYSAMISTVFQPVNPSTILTTQDIIPAQNSNNSLGDTNHKYYAGYFTNLYVTADKINVTQQVVDSSNVSPVINLTSNICRVYTSPLVSLTISSIPTDSFECEIQFTTDSSFTFTSQPLVGKWLGVTVPEFEANTSYIIAIKNGYAVLGKVGA